VNPASSYNNSVEPFLQKGDKMLRIRLVTV